MHKEKLENPSRRNMFKFKHVKQETYPRLPWVISEAIFIEKCSQCEACITSCETQIINKDPLGFPRIDFNIDECTFCNKCIEACPEALFIAEAQRENTRPWQGKLSISQSCFAQNDIYCQSCRDVCDSNAINFSYTNAETNITQSIPTPHINLSDCSQCGACISTCPQKSISLLLDHNNTLTQRAENA